MSWNHSLCILPNSNSVVWNASPDLSVSNTTPDTDVLLCGELVICSVWHCKYQALIFVDMSTFVCGEYYLAFCGSLKTGEESLGTNVKRASFPNYHPK